jgi:L,D-peptidoglycan transpeptidase YkuD (ErfK/YbiS/YcfS/YnhG family)
VLPLPQRQTITPVPTATASAKPAETPKPTPKASPKPIPTPTAAPALLVDKLANRGGAQQVVIVTASSWSTDVATLQTFQLTGGRWLAVYPAMPAHIGRAGFSTDKREGDDKTPAGIFGFNTMFGQHANPGGLKYSYRRTDASSVWVDDVTSPFYNTWQENAALKGEHLNSTGFAATYGYAVDISYNESPVVAGKGSAIFLHVSDGNGTAGCVSLPQADLLDVLRWLDPTKHPVIVMAPFSAIDQY